MKPSVVARWILGLSLGYFVHAAPAHARDYSAALGSWEVTVPLAEGTEAVKEDPARHHSEYRFIVVDQASLTQKIELTFFIDAFDQGIPRDAAEAQQAFRDIIQASQLNIPQESVRVLSLDDVNPNWLVYWAPYYHLRTGDTEKPFLVHKLTSLIDKSHSVLITITSLGLLTFREAAPQDVKLAEDVMDQMLVGMVQNASIRKATAEAGPVLERLPSAGKVPQPKPGSVVIGYLSVREGDAVPEAGDFAPDVHLRIHSSESTPVSGKILKIYQVGQELLKDGTKENIFEVDVEVGDRPKE